MSASDADERYESAGDLELPNFTDLEFVESVDSTSELIEATKYDTPDRHLERAGMELVRRKGGDDPGWALLIDDGSEAAEILFESRATTPPREASGLLMAIRGGQRLVMSEKLARDVAVHRMLDEQGDLVAIVEDTTVLVTYPADDIEPDERRALRLAAGPAGTKRTQKAVRKLLRSAGASPVKSVPAAPSRPPLARPQRKKLAGVVDDYLQAQLAAIAAGDLALRRGHDEVHAVRVGVRRLRTTLRLFADVFDDAKATEFRAELTWFGRALGDARDVDVAGERAVAALASLPDSTDVDAIAEDLDAKLSARSTAARDALAVAMSSGRYQGLVEVMDAWRVDPPFTEASSRSKQSVEAVVAAARREMNKKLHAAAKPGADDETIHDARKAAKRLRYAAELAAPVLDKAASLHKEGHRWQRALGELQDCRITVDLLHELGVATPARSADVSFTYGLLAAQELQRADSAKSAIKKALR